MQANYRALSVYGTLRSPKLEATATALAATVGALVAALLGAPGTLGQSMAAVRPASVKTANEAETQRPRGTAVYRADSEVTRSSGDTFLRSIGNEGFSRLLSFSSLQDGWDGESSRSLSALSLTRAIEFFDRTGLSRPDVAIFMSRNGNIVVNWNQNGQLIELEFTSDGTHYFIESSDSEGVVPATYAGDESLMSKF